jgi:hypothetical protein
MVITEDYLSELGKEIRMLAREDWLSDVPRRRARN